MSTESTADTEDIADLSYEQARDELVAIVSRIEGGNASLEESMELWERGEALAAHCQAKLDQAQDQLDRGAAGAGANDAGAHDAGDGDAADGSPADDRSAPGADTVPGGAGDEMDSDDADA